MTVQWKIRDDGKEPKNTNFTNIDLRYLDPLLLLRYYESRLRFNVSAGKEKLLKAKEGKHI